MSTLKPSRFYDISNADGWTFFQTLQVKQWYGRMRTSNPRIARKFAEHIRQLSLVEDLHLDGGGLYADLENRHYNGECDDCLGLGEVKVWGRQEPTGSGKTHKRQLRSVHYRVLGFRNDEHHTFTMIRAAKKDSAAFYFNNCRKVQLLKTEVEQGTIETHEFQER